MSRELLVVGGGTAGLVAARTAAGLGARVLLVERERTGGDCLWTGCVPSKALLAAAHAAADARAAAALGVHADVRVDFAQVRAHVRAAIEQIAPVDSVESLRAAGVEVRHGSLAFTGPRSATIDGETITFRRAVIATGSSPRLPDVDGLEDALTTDTVWDLEELPARLLVIGGGAAGCELGQAFARLGSAVTIVEQAPTLLEGTDGPVGGLELATALRADGIDLRLETSVSRVVDGTAFLDDGSAVVFDHVLVVAGRRFATADLGLAAAGVEAERSGSVRVDQQLRTSNPRVWAAGDVTGRALFTHVAGMDGSIAASNAVLGLRRKATQLVPRVVYTRPEIASVGETPGPGCTVRRVEHTHVDRAVTEGDTAGFSSIVVRKGRVVGGLVVGPRAGDVIAEVVLAVRTGMKASDLAGTIHAYPGHADGVWNAAIADVRASLSRPVPRAAVWLLRVLRRLRG